MDNLLFNIIAVVAVAGFVLGIISSYLPLIVLSLIIAGLFLWLTREHR